ncbi:MAG: amidohydrolase family protein, partial [Parvularculaceae bacterium]|nr:amidohydrolase family protein [Parvularculaceae bacterium]
AMDPLFLPGFSDAGAHLTNIAFYDAHLRALRLAHEAKGDEGASIMVRRLTRDAARLFGLDAGAIEPGAQADVVLIDPQRLMRHDGEAATERVWREALQTEQLVVRSDGVVRLVLIRGEVAWSVEGRGEALATRKLGRVLKAA